MSDFSKHNSDHDQEKVDLETLEGLEPVSSLSDSRLRELADETYIENIDAMKCLFVEGDKDGEMIYLLSGEVELRSASLLENTIISASHPKAWVPIANSQPRRMTALTKTPVEIIRIDLDRFDQLLTWDQMASSRQGTDSDKLRVTGMGENWRNRLKTNLSLNNLPPANIEQLFERMEPMDVSAGQVIIRQGDPGDYFYLIDNGSAKVTRIIKEGMEPIELAVLGPGVSFGEEALVSNKPRNANVTMLTDGKLFRLSKPDFDELLKAPLEIKLDLDVALQMAGAGAVFLDVRVPSEFAQGHLPDSINIPLNELRQRIDELDRDVEYICYCNTGRRSSAASFILSQQGIHASKLNKGMQAVPASMLTV